MVGDALVERFVSIWPNPRIGISTPLFSVTVGIGAYASVMTPR